MGDDKAAVLAGLYSKYSQALRKYIARLVRDREEADDLAQRPRASLLCIRAPSVDRMDPERIALARETVRILDDVVRALPPKCRRIVIMHKFQHMSYAVVNGDVAFENGQAVGLHGKVLKRTGPHR